MSGANLPEQWQGKLPTNWEWVKLNRVAHLGTGHTPDRSRPELWTDCEVPWVTAADLSERTSAFEPLKATKQKVSRQGLENSAAVEHPAGTVMFCRTASVGLFCVTGVPMATTQAFVTWTPGPRLDSRFLLYVIAAMRPEFDRLAYGSTHLTIYMPELEAVRVPLPPLEVQRRIADFLDDQVARIDRAIQLRQRQIELSKERAKTLIDDLVLGHQVPDKVKADWPPFGWVPKRWTQARLRSIPVEVQTGPFGSQLHADEYVEGGFPIVNPANMVDFGVRETPGVTVDAVTRQRLSRHVLLAGDVVFARRGELGRSALISDREAGWLCGTGSLVVRMRDSQLDPGYLARLLRTHALKWYFECQSVGSTMANLNTSILTAMPLLLPNRAEQSDVNLEAGQVEEAGAAGVSLLTRSLELLEERKRSLVTAAVTGEFDVSSASLRAANVVTEGV